MMQIFFFLSRATKKSFLIHCKFIEKKARWVFHLKSTCWTFSSSFYSISEIKWEREDCNSAKKRSFCKFNIFHVAELEKWSTLVKLCAFCNSLLSELLFIVLCACEKKENENFFMPCCIISWNYVSLSLAACILRSGKQWNFLFLRSHSLSRRTMSLQQETFSNIIFSVLGKA